MYRYKQHWDNQDNSIVVLMENGEYIGSYNISITIDSITLETFYINEKYRNKGYGRKLLRILDEELNRLGNNNNDIYLSVRFDNYIAISMYNSIGFEYTRRAGGYIWMKRVGNI